MAVASASAFEVDSGADADGRSTRRRQSPATIQKKNRSKTTNGRLLEGIDLRTSAGRRYRDLCKAYEAEVGGALSESDRAVIRQAAALTLRSEQQQSALIRGEVVDEDQLVRLSGAAKRLLQVLARKAKARKPETTTLASYLEERHREAAE